MTVARQLFVAGCPRSGTSALAFLLNEHPRVVLGFERFKRVRSLLDPVHFTPEHFFAPVTAETDIRGDRMYARLRQRWEAGGVEVIGDKVPLYTRVLPSLLTRFPGGRVIVMIRRPADVADSFDRRARDPDDWWPATNGREAALKFWNEALAATREAEGEGFGERLFLMSYDGLLDGDVEWVDALLGFLGLPATTRLRHEHAWLAGHGRPPGSASTVARAAETKRVDHDLAAWAHDRMQAQLRDAAPPSTADPDEPPLTEDERGQRELERAELLAEMRRPGAHAAAEVEVLEKRFLAQSSELARRGDRIRSMVTAPPSRRDRQTAITLITPHQRPTSGGAYVIQQFARSLAEFATVFLAVRRGSVRPVPGVDVQAIGELTEDSLPPADVLVYPADAKDAARILTLDPSRGRPVMMFQGYGTPGSAVVRANLRRARESVAVSHWLIQEATRRGAPCAYVPLGLDRETYVAGPPLELRPPRITLMSHTLDWKGTDDVLDAVARIRVARPDAEIVAFGVREVAGVDRFLDRPSRSEVAELLRTSAVHLVGSWQEGFGLPGAEAIACGAALATTDTLGSRDYAIHGRTALVSKPRQPEALAENAVRLLRDRALSQRLVRDGQSHLHSCLPAWPEAARRLLGALLRAPRLGEV